MRKAFHSSETKYGPQNLSVSFHVCYGPTRPILSCPSVICFHNIWKSSTRSENTPPRCFWSVCVDVFIPGCPLCRAAAVVWRCVCVPSSGRGRRARSGCCLRRDAAAGSSAPQQTPCAPGRHGKNWSWTPLRGEKGRRGGEKNRKRQAEGEEWTLISTHFVLSWFKGVAYTLSMNWATGTPKKSK